VAELGITNRGLRRYLEMLHTFLKAKVLTTVRAQAYEI
jgi:hypothetical protein